MSTDIRGKPQNFVTEPKPMTVTHNRTTPPVRSRATSYESTSSHSGSSKISSSCSSPDALCSSTSSEKPWVFRCASSEDDAKWDRFSWSDKSERLPSGIYYAAFRSGEVEAISIIHEDHFEPSIYHIRRSSHPKLYSVSARKVNNAVYVVLWRATRKKV